MLEHDLERFAVEAPAGITSSPMDAVDPKECAALLADASGAAACAKESVAAISTILDAIKRLSGDNRLVLDLASIAGVMALELQDTMEDTRTRYLLEAERYETSCDLSGGHR